MLRKSHGQNVVPRVWDRESALFGRARGRGRQHGQGTKRLVPARRLLVCSHSPARVAPPHTTDHTHRRPACLPPCPYIILVAPLTPSLAASLVSAHTHLASLCACSFSLSPWRPRRRLAATASPVAADGPGGSRGRPSSAWTSSSMPPPPSASLSAAPRRPSLTWTPRSCCSRCGGRRRRKTDSTSACRRARAPRCWPAAPASRSSPTTASFTFPARAASVTLLADRRTPTPRRRGARRRRRSTRRTARRRP